MLKNGGDACKQRGCQTEADRHRRVICNIGGYVPEKSKKSS